jgi:hypothetical protein
MNSIGISSKMQRKQDPNLRFFLLLISQAVPPFSFARIINGNHITHSYE